MSLLKTKYQMKRILMPELALDHDADAVAEGVGLLHGVRGEDGAAVLLEAGQHGVPHEPLGHGVHPSAVREAHRQSTALE